MNHKDTLGYYHCEGENCQFYSKKAKSLIYFKGKRLCRHCKLKASKCNMYLPKENPAYSTILNQTRLPEGKYMPRDKWKDKIKVSPKLKEWAIKMGKKSKSIRTSLSLSKDEQQFFYRQFRQRFSHEETLLKIELIKQNIRNAHEKFKLDNKTNVPSFAEEFEKLING